MYKLKNIKEVHLEITNRCQARCPMCPRRVYGGPINPLMELDEIDLDKFKLWFSDGLLCQLDSLFMCGNLGDPIMAKDCLDIFTYIRQVNPSIRLGMHTNGSARTPKWWEKLAQLQVKVTFGIDGTSHTHSRYRINTDWNLIINNAKAFIDAGGIAEWHMLVFDHNQHEVEQCRSISSEVGFVDFKVKHTSRFNSDHWIVLNDIGQTVDRLYPSSKSATIRDQIKQAAQDEFTTVSCKAVQAKQIYVSANGIVTPCCWLDFWWVPAFDPSRIDYMDKIGQMPNLNKSTLEEIFSTGYFDKIASTWNTSSCLKKCSQQCGIVNKRDIQFENS